eukprot:CAMPEP_0174722406 /NCGR_PEP_ID=MMETSP1094-20130205/38375_1 /TAXON_ID=156173 /ORGANISM="Chrysochromulina brevifilum, Strain UTEX LB 985" /LENGTH=212 /DNA_ID=CAMNT_0015923257 /DNA_START=17 /DNA_END=655 /DNA_ORIENTATION=-
MSGQVNERRVDGDKVTELWPARDWVTRPDANQLVPDEKNLQPPTLPRHAARDHLHDRNREQTLFDPANPGLTTYVRVTRRRMPTEFEEQQARERNRAAVQQHMDREAAEAAEANELLELRSMGIRSVITERNKAGPYGRQAVKVPPANMRADTLEKKLGVDKVNLVSSPLQIDTTAQAGHNTAAVPPPGRVPGKAKAQTVREQQLRGGWPVK